jgi:EAL domain-containing protein (putative c-di-GMP-specific phosphodiesterase class I)
VSLENGLRLALERDEFVLYYQPQVESGARRILGLEALIRWRSPEQGLVPPMQFIPLMEETGLILPVGAWALEHASLDYHRFAALGLPALRIAVNVSPIQLRQRDFVDSLRRAIADGRGSTGIDLEITESVIMEDIQASIEKLTSVRALGVNIAIDDFGTGYSSLAYLARLPLQSLKIDRSFIVSMLDDPDTMAVVSAVISLAHSLKLKVVAEGVDSEDQASALLRLRCDEMQGYLFSEPVPFEAMAALLKTGIASFS